MSNPLVSVIIPVWGEYLKYLPRALKSVEEQTYDNIEIIVVTAERTTAPRACNEGWRKAKGKYIAFLGADDTWSPDKIKLQVGCMEYLPNCAICTCWSEDNRFNMQRISKTPYSVFYKDILKAFNYSSGSTYMIRKEPMLMYDESLLSGQEYDLALRLLNYTGNFAICVPSVGVKQYETKGQISTNWGKKIRGIWQLAQRHGKDYDMIDWLKVVGLLGLYTSGYIFGTKIYKLITYAKERYE